LLEYRSVTAYGQMMDTPSVVPGPRAALDEGSVQDLWLDAAQVVVPVSEPRDEQGPTGAGPLVVPDDAADLLGGLPSYGS